MAIPLEPDMPRLLDVPIVEPFVEAPELAEMAAYVMSKYDEFRVIDEAVRESELLIGYAWETKPWTSDEDLKPHTIGKLTKFSPLVRCFAGQKALAMQFRQWFWDHMDAKQREAEVYHQLTHIEVRRSEEGDLQLKMREHDIEEFGAVMRRFGPIIPGRRQFIKQYLAWQDEQEGREPVQLRTVEALAAEIERLPAEEQAAVHAVVDAQVALNRAGIDDAKTTIRVGDGPEIAVDLEHPSPEFERATRRLVRDSLGISDPCPYPGCTAGADHDGDHEPA